MFQTFTLIWYVVVVHCEHPVHQIWNSTAARSVVYDIFTRAVRMCRPKGAQPLSNRVIPIDNWRKSSKEHTAERSKISTIIPNTANGEKLRRMMYIGEQSNSMSDSNYHENAISIMPDGSSASSEHISDVSTSTNAGVVPSPTEEVSRPASLNMSSTAGTDSSSPIEYKSCKTNIYNQPDCNRMTNESPNDQILNLGSLINSFCETSTKREQGNSNKTYERVEKAFYLKRAEES